MEAELRRTILAGLIIVAVAACNEKDATVVSRNLSTAADQFEINRRVIFYNGITDQYLLTIEGLCSLGNASTGRNSIAVTCKTGPNTFKKHFLGISDNVTFFVEQLEPAKASAFHYRVVFKPQSIIPDIDIRGNANVLPVPTINR